MKCLLVSLGKWAVVFSVPWGAALAQDINPFPRATLKTVQQREWTFRSDSAGWTAANDCSIQVIDGNLRIQCSGNDPYLIGPPVKIEGPAVALLRMKCSSSGSGQIFWSGPADRQFSEGRSQHFPLNHDGQWHDYRVSLPADGWIGRLRLDPGDGPGTIELKSLKVLCKILDPLEILSVHTDGPEISVRLTNCSAQEISFKMDGREIGLGPSSTADAHETIPFHGAFAVHEIQIDREGLPALRRTVALVDTNAREKWIEIKSGHLVLRADRDGAGARVELDGQLVAVLAPLVAVEGAMPRLKLVKKSSSLEWRGDGVFVQLSLRGDEIHAAVKGDHVREGPVLRAYGALQQGLFAGLEYLAAGEHSSSTLDIETEEHIRYAPDPVKVTMPLMAFVTDKATTAMTWDDMALQPVYATPNFLDGPEGHRASLRGHAFDCTILVRKPAPLEDAILWAVNRRGLPPLPEAPRAPQAELDFCLKTLSIPPLKTAEGWGHTVDRPHQPFADQASTVWRLSGEIPSLPGLVPDGSHINNDAIYFVTGRAREWLDQRRGGIAGIIAFQKPDGSFRYEGEYRRGHFEDTASGFCGAFAMRLLEYARLTGDAAALSAGVKALDYIKHFHDPRGAQTWECPLHTPDILASAYLVQAYVRGYELTGHKEYLERARAWAITGLPFVYQWGNRPIMAYATIAVYGASNWRAPNWMGMPVQWCGYDYAYALNLLAPLDNTFDWKKAATGILRAAEQMQYPEGELAGCEPDSFNLAPQTRNLPAINPCAIVSLALALDGRLDSLAVANADGHRIVAPFPVTISAGAAHVAARNGVNYQVLIDGSEIKTIKSHGNDVVPLDGAP